VAVDSVNDGKLLQNMNSHVLENYTKFGHYECDRCINEGITAVGIDILAASHTTSGYSTAIAKLYIFRSKEHIPWPADSFEHNEGSKLRTGSKTVNQFTEMYSM